MKKVLLLLFLFTLFFNPIKASHLMGGEITWECIKPGNALAGMYIFRMKVYRDCNGISAPTNTQTIDVHNHPSITGISVDFISQIDMTPLCDPLNSGNGQMDCANPQQGSVEAYLYESQPINLPGLPPAGGWHFTWDNCCRNGAITNGFANAGFTLRAVMYPYTISGVQQNTSPCFDSSPVFNEKPKTIICTGYPFSYSHNASDPELDEIVYSWADPLDDGVYNPAAPVTLPFSAPYSTNSPLPGNPILDPATGEISYFSVNTSGNFVTCVKVSAYKCGQLVAEVFREIQVVLLNCPNMGGGAGVNNKPIVTPPFNAGTQYNTTVFAGALVQFNISGTDNDVYSNGSAQDLTLEVSGAQFSADYINPTLCLNPPCATFNNGAGVTPPFSAPTTVNGVFEWQTDCSHIAANVGCNLTSNLYTFLIKVFDDFCPAPAITIATISIEVLPAPIDNPPDIRCVAVDASGDVTLGWEHQATVTSSSIYSVYSSANANGPFTLLDTVGYPTKTYLHTGAGADNTSVFYYLTSESDCAGTSAPSDTLKSIKLDVTPIVSSTIGDLLWNQIHIPALITSAGNYTVYAKDGSGAWLNVGTTPDTAFQFPAQTCGSYQAFYIALDDASGCVSNSSIEGANLQDTISPNTPIIDVVTVAGGKSEINWTSTSSDVDVYVIYILDEFGAWITIDSVFGALNTTYIYNGSIASDKFESFRVRALDSCDNASGTSLIHNTIHLESELDVCAYSIYFNWNNYNNMVGNLSHYKVMITENTASGGTINTEERFNIGSNNYTLKDIASGSIYDVVVVAYNSDSTIASYSNVINVNADLFPKPQFNYITTATVNHETEAIELSCYVDNAAVIDYYKVFRSKRYEENYISIANIPFNGQANIYYTDNSVSTSDHFYKYQVYPVDTCGVMIGVGSVEFAGDTSFAQSVLIEAISNKDMTNDIEFNNYDGWLGDDVEYNLYRSVNRGDFSALALATFTGGSDSYSFQDNVVEFTDGNGRFCYYVEALEGSTNPYGFVERSKSNISCVSQTPILIVPNTFTPNDDEQNEIFYPTTSFVSEIGYSFAIYDKWGHEIFRTNDPSKGWDGNFLGNPVQNGNYVYHVQYINGIGMLTEKTDVVNLLR
ncbi:MAG: gliding motility-associated C-terminal domain-containing protein [Flavobacteriales bacterium]|nr:gliding motility-associated C-terminal domain-containing protein [Flavobacteriales bacterium]